jgi:hypothetical protein
MRMQQGLQTADRKIKSEKFCADRHCVLPHCDHGLARRYVEENTCLVSILGCRHGETAGLEGLLTERKHASRQHSHKAACPARSSPCIQPIAVYKHAFEQYQCNIHCGGGSRSAHRAAAARQVLSGGEAVFLRKRVSSWLNFFTRKHNSLGRERFECISVALLDLVTGEAPVNKDWIIMTTVKNTT